ncbi:MAG: ABC transporter permease [archaeon]
MMTDYFSLAFKKLTKRRLRAWLTILGIFIGIMAVVSLISLGEGLRTAVIGQFGAVAVDVLTVQNKGVGFAPPGSTVIEKLNDNDLEIIRDMRGVERVIPRILRVGQLEYNGISGFGYGIDMPDNQDDLEFIYDRFSLKAAEGRLFSGGDKGKVILGGDFLDTESFGKQFLLGKKIMLVGEVKKDYEIVGILEKTSSFQLNSVVYLMHEDMVELFQIKDEYDFFAVQVTDKNQIEEVASDIERALRNDRNEKIGEETFSVQTPIESLEAVNNVLNIINIIVIGIAAISLLVGGIGIANTMYTSVLERTKEIGVMKAIGAQNKDILWIFLIESGMLGLVGGIIGGLAGLGAAVLAANLANSALGNPLFQVAVSYPLLIGAILFSFLVGALAGILPAYQASRLNPVEALRG